MTDSLREIVHRFLGSCVWQCREAHTEDCDALVKELERREDALIRECNDAWIQEIGAYLQVHGFDLDTILKGVKTITAPPKQVQVSGPQCKKCGGFTTYKRRDSHGLCMKCELEAQAKEKP